MARPKSVAVCSIPFWLRATSGLPEDSEKFFIQLGVSLMQSVAFTQLDHGVRNLYLRLTLAAKGKREFTFSWHDAQMKAGYTSRTTFYKHLKTLENAGFIETVKNGKADKTKSEYQFSFRWKSADDKQPRGKKRLYGWLSGRQDNKEPFVQIGMSLFESAMFRWLSPAEQNLYLCMAVNANGSISTEDGGNQIFTYTAATAKRDGFKKTTLEHCLDTLLRYGFIERVASGKHNFTPSEYRFSSEWKKIKELPDRPKGNRSTFPKTGQHSPPKLDNPPSKEPI